MIHMHGGPLSGPKDIHSRFWRGRHAMVSFAYPDSLPVVAESCQSFALDNGAFTTWKSGKTLDVRDYADWVRAWCRHPGFAWCLVPDVIEGSESDNDALLASWNNLGSVRVLSVPVWHFHESTERLQWLAANYHTVALGSSGQWATPGNDAWWERVAEFMPFIVDAEGRPKCKLHGLRMLNPEIFTRLPFASADSTNAAQNAGSVSRFGSYPAPEAWQRATVIADRIEAYNSAPCWQASERQPVLFGLENHAAGA